MAGQDEFPNFTNMELARKNQDGQDTGGAAAVADVVQQDMMGAQMNWQWDPQVGLSCIVALHHRSSTLY